MGIIVLLLLSCFIQVKAQSYTKIGIGAELDLPSGNFAGLSAYGLGTSVKIDFTLSEEIGLSLNGGIVNFFGKHNQLVTVQDLTYVPLKMGLKYNFSNNFYAEAQLGAALPLTTGQKTFFVWSPGIGNFFKLQNKNLVDVGIRYEAWTGKNNEDIVILNSSNNKGFIGLRVAYVFGL